MAELKTKQTDQSVQKFLNDIPDPVKRKDCKTVGAMMKEISGYKPKMWGPSIVGFGNAHYKYDSGREGDWPVLAFSPRKQSLTLYVLSGADHEKELLQKLGKHTTAKSCLYIKRLSDVDLPTLKTLIRKSFKRKRYFGLTRQ
jgi:Domain of unknown function (DU1801)